jgi:hypothetical protein
MTFKSFLPMGEKPPEIIGRGSPANTNQAPTVLSFPPSQQFPEEPIVSRLLPLRSTDFMLIVVNFYMLSTLATTWTLPIHCHITHPHRNPAATSNYFSTMTTTMITTINTTTIININTTGHNNITTLINSDAHPITITSFTSVTVATTTTKATVFSTATTTKISLSLRQAPNSNQASFENDNTSYAFLSAGDDTCTTHVRTTTAVVTNVTITHLLTISPFAPATMNFAATTKYTTTAHPYTLDCSTAVNTTIDIMAASASNTSTTDGLTPVNQQMTAHPCTDTKTAPYKPKTARGIIVRSFLTLANHLSMVSERIGITSDATSFLPTHVTLIQIFTSDIMICFHQVSTFHVTESHTAIITKYIF